MPRPSLVTVLRVYVLLTLVAAAVVAPTLMTLVPLAIFAGYLVVWRWPISRAQLLLTDSLVFYALALLFEASLGAWCLLLALPLLYLVGNDLERLAVRRRVITTVSRRRPTNIAMTLLLMALGAVLISQILASLALLLSGGLALVSLAVLYFLIWLRLPLTPLRVATREQRILVSAHQVFRVAVAAANPLGGTSTCAPLNPG